VDQILKLVLAPKLVTVLSTNPEILNERDFRKAFNKSFKTRVTAIAFSRWLKALGVSHQVRQSFHIPLGEARLVPYSTPSDVEFQKSLLEPEPTRPPERRDPPPVDVPGQMMFDFQELQTHARSDERNTPLFHNPLAPVIDDGFMAIMRQKAATGEI